MSINLGLVAILITLGIIVGSVITKRCLEFMFAGSMVAAVFLFKSGFLAGWAQSLQDQLSENVWVMLVCLLFGGLIGLCVGGELIVKSAVDIAMRMGVSEAIIGLTIVALGTSLPELATSVIAATKHNSDIALGNVFGSNIFNVFFILATSATIHPLPAYDGIELDAIMAALGSIIVWMAVKIDKKRKVQRWAGALLLLVYAGYLTYRLLNI